MNEKPVTKPKKRDQSRAKNQPKFTVGGRPGKRTPQVEKALLEAVATGAPYRICCMAVGISDDTFTEWRRKDPEFRQKVEQAAGKTALAIMKRIREHGEENFAALSWLLERRFPESYGRPEAQFQINNLMNNVTNNTLVITAEVASELESRSRRVHAEVERLFENRRLKGTSGHGNGATPKESAAAVEVESEVVPSEIRLPVITLPAGDTEPSGSWWRQLSTGSNERRVSREAFEYACRQLVREVRGPAQLKYTAVDVPDEPTLRDLHSTIDRLLGDAGWAKLKEKAVG